MYDKKKFAILRTVLGAIWAVDACFKWQPDFSANFTDCLSGNLDAFRRKKV